MERAARTLAQQLGVENWEGVKIFVAEPENNARLVMALEMAAAGVPDRDALWSSGGATGSTRCGGS